jgi:hypothetical protein
LSFTKNKPFNQSIIDQIYISIENFYLEKQDFNQALIVFQITTTNIKPNLSRTAIFVQDDVQHGMFRA